MKIFCVRLGFLGVAIVFAIIAWLSTSSQRVFDLAEMYASQGKISIIEIETVRGEGYRIVDGKVGRVCEVFVEKREVTCD